MDPLAVELADDPLRARAREMQHVELDHLRDVLEEMRGLVSARKPRSPIQGVATSRSA
jgi:hypothetical protein